MSPQKLEEPNSFCCSHLLCAKSRTALAAISTADCYYWSFLPLATEELQELSEKRYLASQFIYLFILLGDKHSENKLRGNADSPTACKQASVTVLAMLCSIQVLYYSDVFYCSI